MSTVDIHKTIRIFGMKVDCVTMDDAYKRFVSFMTTPGTQMIFTPNPEFVMTAQEDSEFMEVLNAGDLVVPDGIGLLLASKVHKLGLTERVPGIELMGKMLEYANRTEKSIYLFGGKPGVGEAAAENILKAYPNIKLSGTANGYVDQSGMMKVLDDINEKKPDLLFVALGAPKQEKWIYTHRKLLDVSVAMGVGGALDVWAGTVKRAPRAFQKLGLEWFYRLLKQPSRVLRMMVLPKFMIRVLLTRHIDEKIKG